MSGSKLDPGGRAASTRLRYASASFTFTTGSRFGMMMARPKWLAVNGSDAFSIAPSRTCRCQSSGLRRVIFNGDPSAYAHHAGFVGVARRMIEHRAGEVGDAGDAFFRAPFLQSLDQRDHRRRVAETGEADFHRGRAGEEVFDHVVDLHDAAAADDRDLHAPGALVHHEREDP